MKLFVLMCLLSLPCGCSLRQSDSPSRSAQVQRLVDNLDGLAMAQVGPSSEVSNKLYKLKDVAIPLLTQRVSSLNYDDRWEVRRVAGACMILGTNAYPILTLVLKDADSRDFKKQSGACLILQCAGTASFGLVIDFLKTHPMSHANRFLKKNLLVYVEDFPVNSVLELLRLYRVTNKSAEVKELINSAFTENIFTEDFNSLLPVTRPLLKQDDPFLISSVLQYIKRCGPTAVGTKNEITPLLTHPDAQIRAGATNAIKSIERSL